VCRSRYAPCSRLVDDHFERTSDSPDRAALSKSIEAVKFAKNLIAITTHLLLLDDKAYWNDRFTFLFPHSQTIFPAIPTTKFLHFDLLFRELT
jgi:hypothetical protein